MRDFGGKKGLGCWSVGEMEYWSDEELVLAPRLRPGTSLSRITNNE